MSYTYDQKHHILKTQITKGRTIRQRWDKFTTWYLGESIASHAGSQDGRITAGPQGQGYVTESEEFRMDTNYPFAFIDTMVANICPTNPQITMNPHIERLAGAAGARESLVNDTFRRDRMFKKSWDIAAFSALCGVGFSKTTWDDKRKHPTTRILNPRNIFWDPTTEWDYTRYVIEAVPLTEQEFNLKLAAEDESVRYVLPDGIESVKYDSIPTWLVDKRTNQSLYTAAAFEVFKWVITYEFHDLVEGTMAIMVEGLSAPVWEGPRPYKFVENPYSKLSFNSNMTDDSGLSDVHLISKFVERLNEVETLELWHAHTSMPIPIVNTTGLTDPAAAMAAYRRASGPGDVAEWKLREGYRLQDILDYSRTPQHNPAFPDAKATITKNIEFTLGIPAYARGTTQTSDVATELALVDTATRTRNGRRVTALNSGWIEDVARKTCGLWREFFPKMASLSLQGRDTFQKTKIDRLSLAFPEDLGQDRQADAHFDEDWYFQFEAVPYSPAENSKLVQLQKLQQFSELLSGSPYVDQGKWIGKLCELLGMPDIRQDPAVAQQQLQAQSQPQGQAPAAPGGPTGTPADTISTGALPEGLDEANEAILPPGTRSLASQPRA